MVFLLFLFFYFLGGGREGGRVDDGWVPRGSKIVSFNASRERFLFLSTYINHVCVCVCLCVYVIEKEIFILVRTIHS